MDTHQTTQGNDDKNHGRDPRPPNPRTVTITVDGKKFEIDQHAMTGAQIKRLAGIDPTYKLFLEQRGDDLPIPDDKRIEMKDGQAFYSVPPATLG